MAWEAYGPKNGWLYGNDYCQAWCYVEVVSETNTQITYKVSGRQQLVNAYLYGMRLEVGYYYSGGSGNYTTLNYSDDYWTTRHGDGDWYPKSWLAGTVTFDKSTSSYTRTFFAWCHSQTVSDYGGYPASSEAKVTVTIPAGVFTTTPNAPTSVTLKKNSDTSHTLSWAFSTSSTKPVTKQERALETNGSWGSATSISNGTTKSANYTTTTNSRYRCRVRVGNSVGWSGWTYSEYTYTTPATPSSATAIKTGNNVSLQAIVSNIRYPKSYQWQRASKSDFSDATTLSGTASVISDSTTLANPYYRVRCLGQSGTYSSWRTATLTINPQLYVLVPDGKTIQDIYINKG